MQKVYSEKFWHWTFQKFFCMCIVIFSCYVMYNTWGIFLIFLWENIANGEGISMQNCFQESSLAYIKRGVTSIFCIRYCLGGTVVP